MKSELSDICFYRKEKVLVSALSLDNYISTENMLSNKGGVTKATTLPTSVNAQSYKKNDILVSNIRPYFKKIWKAETDGGCSNDVLVFSARQGYDSNFLFYVLADDAFFDYATATATGTKMPRGDRNSIMRFKVPSFDIKTQQKIGKIMRNLDERISINQKINDNLAA